MTALFTVVLLLGLHSTFDAPHVQVEPAPIEPSVTVSAFASGTASVSIASSWWDTSFDWKR